MCSNCNKKSEVIIHFYYPETKEYCIECAKPLTKFHGFTAVGGGSSIIVAVKMGLETKEKALKMYEGWPEIEARLNAL